MRRPFFFLCTQMCNLHCDRLFQTLRDGQITCEEKWHNLVKKKNNDKSLGSKAKTNLKDCTRKEAEMKDLNSNTLFFIIYTI